MIALVFDQVVLQMSKGFCRCIWFSVCFLFVLVLLSFVPHLKRVDQRVSVVEDRSEDFLKTIQGLLLGDNNILN